MVAQLNINSLTSKFDSLKEIVKDNVDILLLSETKIDSSFPTTQFCMDGFRRYRHDRNLNGGGIILYKRYDILSTLLNTETSIEGLNVEINVRKKWMIGRSYNPNKTFISAHLKEIGKNLTFILSSYDNFILFCDLNSEPKEQSLKDFCQVYNCKNIIKRNTCFKNPANHLALICL